MGACGKGVGFAADPSIFLSTFAKSVGKRADTPPKTARFWHVRNPDGEGVQLFVVEMPDGEEVVVGDIIIYYD